MAGEVKNDVKGSGNGKKTRGTRGSRSPEVIIEAAKKLLKMASHRYVDAGQMDKATHLIEVLKTL